MNYRFLDKTSKEEAAGLFDSVFTASEGEEEGKLVGELASQLSANIDDEEIICCGACEGESLIACIFFTRLQYREPVPVYMLAPVAVRTEQQGKGVGQTLIRFGLKQLKTRSVKVVITYGDPAFYARVGFRPIPENIVQAPVKLSMPGGWLGQSLVGGPVPRLSGRPQCVGEFNNPVYW